MKEEKNDVSKNKWRQIFRKKWFFPAVYLSIAAVLLTVVIWYQSLDNRLPEISQEDPDVADQYTPTDHDGDVEAVIDQQEMIQMPVAEEVQAEIVTKFYDYNADEEDQENALVFHNNHYYQSTGIDIAAEDGEAFDVLASLSGTVSEVKVDPILGNIVVLSHQQDVATYYASLGEVLVKEGDKVKQGDVIGTAGNNVIGKDLGTHVHFELRKNDKTFNPEAFFNQPISKLELVDEEEVASEETTSEEEADDSEADAEETNSDEVDADEEETEDPEDEQEE